MDQLSRAYAECSARFRRAAADAGVRRSAHPLQARGPGGEELSIDVAATGPTRPRRALVVLSGVHGVEGFIGSAVQADALARWSERSIPDDLGIVIVHAVNPWGMASWRRQNESNVDLNRNWRRDDVDPPANDAYDVLHPLACPDCDELPSVDDLAAHAMGLVAERGMPWVRDGITRGQYRHPDGLHYGGARTEESNRILADVLGGVLAGVERLLTIDLHTGHGPYGELTLLSDQASGTRQDEVLRSLGVGTVEATVDNAEATTGTKVGQIANGLRQLAPDADAAATSAEFGTVDDMEQLAATYLEQWAFRTGRRDEHPELVRRYFECFTPDDTEWERVSFGHGRDLLDAALAFVESS